MNGDAAASPAARKERPANGSDGRERGKDGHGSVSNSRSDKERSGRHGDADRDRERDRDRKRDKHKSRGREKSRDRDAERHKPRDRDAERGKDRDKGRPRDRSRERSRDRDRDRPKSGERDRERSRGADGKARERDRPGESSGRDAERRRRDERPRSRDRDAGRRAPAAPAKAPEPELSEEERQALERKRKVEAWQAKKRALEREKEDRETKERAAAEAAEDKAPAWTLEDDGSDEDAGGGAAPAQAQGDAAMADGDEVDPLDAFMVDVGTAVKQDLQALDPSIAKDAITANPALERSGIKLDSDMFEERKPDVAMDEGGEGGAKEEAKAEVAVKAEAGEETLADMADKPKPRKDKAAKRQRRVARAKARRRAAIERAAPNAPNMYASDSSSSSSGSDDGGGGGDDDVGGGEEEEEDLDDEAWAKAVQTGKASKGDRLAAIDHSTIDYPPFRKAFYIESPDVARMGEAELAELQAEHGGVVTKGKACARPVRTWAQCGLPFPVLHALQRHGYREPLPIQAHALPNVMSGRDVIGVATTGSGKTLAFVLPMLRHISDQVSRGLDERLGNGPVGLIIAPTRELVQQISRELKLFAKALDLTACAAYGGSQVKEQINELKRGVHAVVCTPGRMIDILVTSNGKITNLRRVTMLVIDEADRMFDMGFEPQIMRIIAQIRPDRQAILFSATFPYAVEAVARDLLTDPVAIQVGGRSTVSQTITQSVEIRNSEEERFERLLQLLSEHDEADGKMLIFVNSQDKCSKLYQDLLTYGYANLMLHGDMPQTDRESTINDFKTGACSVLVATSVAARGLDVRDLVLVINYDTPNHLEEYVHRCGRTGRAGALGTAVTFISHADEQYAPDLVKALRDSKQTVPQDLQRIADKFNDKRKKGLVKGHGTGFGGRGFKFNEEEDEQYDAVKFRLKAQLTAGGEEGGGAGAEAARAEVAAAMAASEGAAPAAASAKYAFATELPPEVANMSDERRREAQRIALAAASRVASAARVTETMAGGIRRVTPSGVSQRDAGDSQAALVMAAQQAASKIAGSMGVRQDPAAAARLAAMQSALARSAASTAPVAADYYEAELVINDFPQAARYHVTHRDTIAQIAERTGAAIIIKGQYYAPGQTIPPDDTKLYLLIEGPTHHVVKHAKALIKQMIEEKTEKSMRREAGAMGRSSIL